jgi:hypothetical protein
MFGSWVTPLVGRHVVNESKVTHNVGSHVVIEPRNILNRTFGDSLTCVYTRGPWAVEYLANLIRKLRLFLKPFKAMILGFDFI